MEEKIELLKNIGKIDPVSAMDYVSSGGYNALKKAISNPDNIIKDISESGLRGRSGSGFPVGMKWITTANAVSDQKYIICNADEGEPGTNKDRVILCENPHAVIEGMIIAGIAVGADIGIIYVRREYPYACEILQKAIDNAMNTGYLGNEILGSSYNFIIRIVQGAGAYICGEETALIESIEGKRGETRLKPPFPGVSGLWGKPTVVNNVESFANIPLILSIGSDAFRMNGTEKCPGTKLITLTGNINKPGVYEVSFGTTIRYIFEELGGGCPKGKKLQAIQSGGASGPIIRAELIDTPFDIEGCAAVGAFLGTGSLMFIDEDACIVDLCHNLLEFFEKESCGKCVPCRIGIRRMVELLEKIELGKGENTDIELLEKLANHIKMASRCALGQSAVTPVISAMENFQGVFKNHIIQNDTILSEYTENSERK